jgi:hypothetical protein
MSTPLQHVMLRLVNIYPPFIGAGIWACRVDALTYRIQMKQTIFNANVFGTHFGGVLYAMCAPWFILILMRVLGPGYSVWDKVATIQCIKPGRGTVTATFYIPPELVEESRVAVDASGKLEPAFAVDVLDGQEHVIALVEKLLYVHKKK